MGARSSHTGRGKCGGQGRPNMPHQRRQQSQYQCQHRQGHMRNNVHCFSPEAELGARRLELDELLRVTHGAHNALLDIEELEEDELHRIRQGYTELAESAREKLRRGGVDTDVPEFRPR